MGTSTYHPKENERIRYFRRGTDDGHGGRAEEHREEMRAIAEQVVQIQAPIIAAQIFNQAIEDLIGAIEYDIKTVVKLSFEDMDGIFKSESFRKFVSDRIMKEIAANLKNQRIRI